MATINLSIVIPDAQVQRFQDAARIHWGMVSDGSGGMRNMTNSELVEQLRQDTIKWLVAMVLRVETNTANVAAATTVLPVDAA